MQQIFEKELLQFDRERVIPAWDGLISRQQATLESLGVPTMFVTEFGLDKDVRNITLLTLQVTYFSYMHTHTASTTCNAGSGRCDNDVTSRYYVVQFRVRSHMYVGFSE